MKRFPFLLGGLCLLNALSAQITFQDASSQLADSTFTSGVAVGVADFNGDGLDDLLQLHRGNQLKVSLQNPDHSFTLLELGNTSSQREWSLAAADVNNDGLCDLFTGGSYNGAKILLTDTAGGWSINPTPLPGPGLFVQGSNLVDIDNDGWLDVFACHDDGESRIWENLDGNGFAEADQWIDMRTDPPSDNSGNYGSIWTDFDNDGDLDLYIAKCRLGVDDPTDPRRINALFVNEGNGSFREAAAEFGLKIGWQSWTADFNDIDNDGDLDCLVTNHDHSLQLLENRGDGHFLDITEAAGVESFGYFLQGLLRDFDNDGFVDILTADPTQLFLNNGDRTFTLAPDAFGGANLRSFACGDLNADGFLDVVGIFQESINSPGTQPDRLYLNQGNGNNFLAVRLQGQVSNRSGVGARLELFGEWGVQVREVRAGESYGISNSLTQFFGLGAADSIAYLVVRWPSGRVNVIADPEPNQYLLVEEELGCPALSLTVEVDGAPVICPGATLNLSAAPGYAAYLWSHGAQGRQSAVQSPGNYSVVALDSNGCAALSEVVFIEFQGGEPPRIVPQGELRLCSGDSLELHAEGTGSFLWSTGDTTASIVVFEPGTYSVSAQTDCGTLQSEPVVVEVLSAPPPQTSNDTLHAPGSATLIASGGTISWYDAPVGGQLLGEGDTLLTPEVDETTTFWAEARHVFPGEAFHVGMEMHVGDDFSDNQTNAGIFFSVEAPFLLKSVKVYTDTPGERLIQVLDPDGAISHSRLVNITEEEQVVELDFFFDTPGEDYFITTDAQHNLATFGFEGPRLKRSDVAVFYPYEVEGLVRLTGSPFGQGFYYYFFDWEVETPPLTCVSPRVPVEAVVVTTAVEEVPADARLELHPTLTDGPLTLQFEGLPPDTYTLELSDLQGRRLLSRDFQVLGAGSGSMSLDLRGRPSGLYLLRLQGSVVHKVWKVVVR